MSHFIYQVKDGRDQDKPYFFLLYENAFLFYQSLETRDREARNAKILECVLYWKKMHPMVRARSQKYVCVAPRWTLLGKLLDGRAHRRPSSCSVQ